MSGKRSGKKGKSRVSFVEVEKPKTRLDIMKAELDQMRRRDEEKERAYEEHRQQEIRKMREKMEAERREKGLQLLPDSRLSKQDIKKMLHGEEKHLRKEDLMKQAAETSQMKNEISMKHGTHMKKKAPDLMKLAEEFATPQKTSNTFGLPDRVIRELTLDEIMDLKKVFDMYDVAGAGYISRKAVKNISAILGFRASKEAIKNTLDSFIKDPAGKVTFVTFLEFIIKHQEGNDPFEEAQQCFRILDREDKGYLTFSDIRLAADEVDCPLSNNQIQEMLDEADTSGNAEVELGEFVMMMLRTSAFKF
ncbi:uncharacterized protein LOC132756041 [Ruditapes philippinarum]|uniref:uncharacterized protein LOC132756041 n=1 Tax=Ruditapes philippinarum TaxID=129788 RepID=UPI00295BAD58|nr:uncharacterized protein LOC132756041 [Ruditapes philippinarum]